MEPLDKLVVSVDEALYKAKQQGKKPYPARVRLQRRHRPLRWAFLFFPEKMKTGFNYCVMPYTQSR
ncbi:diguanylate cyclase/phosphodiesterase [Klebsiella pneumoniae]|uniref:Diguanylate cyclase/phosphodiesterase n=1 Tax=Klebsiella pneumoniae TaxID=573 RepID=A0A377USK6_KLEPN|nr:diguanylate cyclase/phosphodiesterase [Klebsiella pneumoniae]